MSKELDWGDSDLRSMTTKMSNWYKCTLGYKDVIRVAAGCDSVFRHNWQANGKFQTCHCSREDHGTCPVCDAESKLHSHARTMTYATVILHIFRQAHEGKPKLIGKLLAWRFGDDKKTDLLEIHELTNGKLKSVDLRIVVKGSKPDDEKFQKLSIKHMQESVITKLADGVKNNLVAMLNDTNRIKELKKLYHPTPEELSKFLNRDREESDGATTFDPTDYTVEEKDKASATQTDAVDDNSVLFQTGEDPLAGVLD